jgi:hypothetical protein
MPKNNGKKIQSQHNYPVLATPHIHSDLMEAFSLRQRVLPKQAPTQFSPWRNRDRDKDPGRVGSLAFQIKPRSFIDGCSGKLNLSIFFSWHEIFREYAHRFVHTIAYCL